MPDLAVTKASAGKVTLGSPLAVRYTVASRGRRGAPATQVAFFLSRNAVRDRRDVRLRSVRLAALRRGAARRGRAVVKLPTATAAQGARIVVCADPRRRVREASERNNCRATRPLVAADPAPPARDEPRPDPAPAPLDGPTEPPVETGPTPPPDDGDSPGTISVEGVSRSAFNPLASQVRFVLSGAEYTTYAPAVQLWRNDAAVPPGLLTVTGNEVTYAGPLLEGRNHLKLGAMDRSGRNLASEIVVWAGSATLTVNAVDAAAAPQPGADVKMTLADDAAVGAEGVADALGKVQFGNVPNRTLLLEGSTESGLSGASGTTGNAGSTDLVLLGFNPPSGIDNNDFSQGLAGWDLGSAPVTLIAHTEARREGEDMDLRLSTSGEGPERISRTFTVEEDVEAVAVRYRFVTSEVPGGYFGTKYNDYFAVSVRAQGGGSSVETNSMNGLGLESFSTGGATAWREEELQVDGAGTVQVDMTVANVADGAFDSQLIVAIVEKKKLAIKAMELRDLEVNYRGVPISAPLNYLSVSPHEWFSGYTRIWGTIKLTGAADDKLTELELEVLSGGVVKARAMLTAGLRPVLYQTFGADKTLAVTVNQLLFSLPSDDTADIRQTTNGHVVLRARAVSEKVPEGATHEYETRPQKLVRHEGTPRYGCCNETEGGDTWVKPTVKPLIESFSSIEWGDASNMNAGPISPHSEHDTGNDTDAWFQNYDTYRDGVRVVNGATAANRMVELLNAADERGYERRIQRVIVTYCIPGVPETCSRDSSTAFYDAIENVTLSDGRAATSVIVPMGGHFDHFHWDMTDGA